MRLGELRKKFKDSKIVQVFDLNGKDISYKPTIILDCMKVVGSEHRVDGTMTVDVMYMD